MADYDEYEHDEAGDGEEMSDAELQQYEEEYGGDDDSESRERYAYAEGVTAARRDRAYDDALDSIEARYHLHDEAEQDLVVDAAVEMGRRAGIEVTDAEFPQVVEAAVQAHRGDLIAMRANSGRFRLGEQG